jgi:uncharacterized RDD family membrane protein YckC
MSTNNPFNQGNPYAAPQISTTQAPATSVGGLQLASRGQRFANWLVDYIAIQIVSFVVGIVYGVLFLTTQGPNAADSPAFNFVGLLLGIGVTLGYYLILEAAAGQTLGKIVTGTRVVSMDGSRPSFGQILGRTFCRLIPFEAFSFFAQDAVGWHDSIPQTRVVRTR